jgi:hypothetical protein
MAYGFIPRDWRQARVACIPKPGKPEYTKAKPYHPISLSSSLLKIMWKLVDMHYQGGFTEVPSAPKPTCLPTGKSTELHFIM